MSLGLALFIFNLTQLDFGALLEGDSKIALIGALASLCSILLLWILLLSKKIQKKAKS